ncbi:ATP-binding protein [Sphingobium sufflavum]|uniref:ATP-binding protein n=1 Tax=Sphingobium sufflavum TaxID=1129547 RepID=UPI001F3C78E6|nr:ATP-binding protein [Sphingobium sufflavum]MCE7795020.1 ATP-binding protein [Sphingobium sufflavum]
MLGLTQSQEKGSDDTIDDLPQWRRVIPVALGLCLAFALALLFVLANRAADDREDALGNQRRSYEVIAIARNLEGTVARAESLLARYVVSVDAKDGQRYSDQWRLAGTLIENLRRSSRDDPDKLRYIGLLRDSYAARGKTLNDIALRTTYDQRLGALGRLYEANRTRDADRIQRILTVIIGHEMKRLNERSTLLDRSTMRADRLAGSYGLVGVVLLVAALVALWVANSAFTERRYARRLADSEARRVDHLELAVQNRTRELEVANGRLRTEMEERAQAEESLRQLHKMEAVGQLTGGIAHDFNNMLAVVIGGLELARRRISGRGDTGGATTNVGTSGVGTGGKSEHGRDTDDAVRHIDNAMEGANRAASLTRRLLAFARAEPLLPAEVDANQMIQGMSELIDRTIGDQIHIVMEPGAEDWRLWADRHQLENALLNLCVNARDAMDGKGTITLSSGQVTLRPGEINDCPGGDYVRLSVRDTGHGMTPDVLSRVFEPFFTTKPVGKGTGLGLSQVFGYIGSCGGEIRILSKPEQGTEVQIFLPRSQRSGEREASRLLTEAAMAPAAPRRSVFVVEDDPRVLAATVAALEELGHHSVSCDHPAQAADLLAQYPGTDIILTDVQMPEMTGPEMIAQMRARGIALPVLFVTGFAGDDAEAGLLDNEHVLRKPFTLAQLDRKIAEASSAPARGHKEAAA